jgi:hypothetical protein
LDDVLLSERDIRQITGFDRLSVDPVAPTDRPQADPTAPGPCKVLLDQGVAFGDDVREFRTVSYGAQTNTAPGQIRGMAIVSQAVGRYSNGDDARAAFDAIEPKVIECSALKAKHYEYAVAAPAPSTLNLTSNVADIVYHVESSALVGVVVIGLPEPRRIATQVTQAINERLD